jgi:uncharacterized membrane protein YuzA (DUF378 family)
MQRTLQLVALILVVVGAVNWGLVGIAQFDLVAALFGGSATLLARVVYALVGLAGLALLATSLAPQHGSPVSLRASRA